MYEPNRTAKISSGSKLIYKMVNEKSMIEDFRSFNLASQGQLSDETEVFKTAHNITLQKNNANFQLDQSLASFGHTLMRPNPNETSTEKVNSPYSFEKTLKKKKLDRAQNVTTLAEGRQIRFLDDLKKIE